jgi:hypothetical protein
MTESINYPGVNMKIKLFIYLFLISTFLHAFDNEPRRKIVDLNKTWKFEIGDNLNWADPEYDDSNWEDIEVPSNWEDEGFPGYDGMAWYRASFKLSGNPDKILFLHLGFIDDADEVYVNGHLVGHKGTFPPNFQTQYNIERVYFLCNEYLNYGDENVIAVRVFDDYNEGGIVRGDLGIYAVRDLIKPDFSLSGKWKFKKGDQSEWRNEDFNDNAWEEVIVPSFWAAYGLKDYDGFGWFRKTFILPKELEEERLILFLGRIDDYDVTYINGHRIGKTGDINNPRYGTDLGNAYQEYRAYYIPREYLNPNGENVIAVRVFDGWLHGGIYGDAPIGIITRERYLQWRQEFQTDNLKSLFEFIFRN